MKTVLTLAVGFWIGRQVYLNHSKKQAMEKEAAVKKQLHEVLKKYRVKGKGIQKEVERIFK